MEIQNNINLIKLQNKYRHQQNLIEKQEKELKLLRIQSKRQIRRIKEIKIGMRKAKRLDEMYEKRENLREGRSIKRLFGQKTRNLVRTNRFNNNNIDFKKLNKPYDYGRVDRIKRLRSANLVQKLRQFKQRSLNKTYINVTIKVTVKNKKYKRVNRERLIFYNIKVDSRVDLSKKIILCSFINKANRNDKHTQNVILRLIELTSPEGNYIRINFLIDNNVQVDNIDEDISDIDMMFLNQSINNKFIDYILKINPISLEYEFKADMVNKFVLTNPQVNACYYNIIIETYKHQIENCVKNGGKQYNFIVDYENLYNLFNSNNKYNRDHIYDSLPLTLRNSVKFFEKFGLNLIVINSLNKVIFEYQAKKKHKLINPNTLKLLCHNNHVFPITKTSNFVKNMHYKELKNKDNDVNISNLYNTNYIEDREVVILKEDGVYNNTKYIFDYLKNIDKNEIKSLVFIYNGTISDIVYHIIDFYKHTPKIYIDHGNISSCMINPKINKDDDKCLNIIIKSPFTDLLHENDMPILNKDYYDIFYKFDCKIHKALINKQYLSYYNEDTLKWFDDYYPSIQYGFLDYNRLKEYGQIDFCKAYTSNLMQLKKIPVVNYFERPRLYNGHQIENYNMYLIEILEKDDIFNYSHTLTYGFNLKKINIKYKIIEYLEPTITYDNDKIKSLIEKLYNSALDIKHKKFIINKTIGMLGKKFNRREDGKICMNLQTAYQLKKSNDDNGHVYELDDNRFYYVNSSHRELKNGFIPIHIAIYDMMRIKLYELKNKLIKNKIKIYGYKVDCIYTENIDVDDERVKQFNNIVHDSDTIFHDKIEDGEVVTYIEHIDLDINAEYKNIGRTTYKMNVDPLMSQCIEYKKIDFKIIAKEPYIPINNIDIKDEYTPDYSNIDNNTIVLANNAGCGKTFLCLDYAIKSEKKFLVIIPYNKTAVDIKTMCDKLSHGKQINCDIKTLHSFFGLNVNNEYLEKKKKTKNTNYDLIIFEEIYTYNSILLYKINNFIKKHKNVQFMANGDIFQLEPIDEVLTELKREEIIKYMFNNNITLNISKRFKNDARFAKIKEILQSNMDDIDAINLVIRKYFKNQYFDNMDEWESMYNISYYNATRNKLNDIVHKKHIKKNNLSYYYVGLNLICKDYIPLKNMKLFRNMEYKITKIEGNKIFLDIDGVSIPFNKKTIENKFTLPYTITNHSCQGITISEKYTIFDVLSCHINKKWLYVAITRATDLNNVYFCIENLKDINKQFEINKKLNKMIDSYKQQDLKADRKINNKKYITVQWIKEQYKLQKAKCYMCSEVVEILSNNDNKLTVDRVDNDRAHHKSNCKLACIHCNVIKK